LTEELETAARGSRPDSTRAVASRYWKSAPVARAALRIAPTTAPPCVPVLSTKHPRPVRQAAKRIIDATHR